jgi:catechol 2,3-dioxygenase-like lactoylglutathione lyase family enzyme
MVNIGGVFLSSHEPQALIAWFRDALGIEMQAQGEGAMAMLEGVGAPIILSVQMARPGAPKPPAGDVRKEPYGRQTMMLNIRVDDMDATLTKLRQAGSRVEGPVPYEGIGQFAWTRTPDGHDIELWQP